MQTKAPLPFKIFSILFFVLIFIYLSLRVIWVEPIHDELATLFHYVDYGTIWKGNIIMDANNHLLNSYLSKVCYSLFGDHIWAIRLPNLFSFIFFYWAIYKIALLFNRSILRYTFVIASAGIPYVLDYFAYSRGYGMSMAFLMVALYFFIVLNKQYSTKNMLILALFCLLSIYANLNLVITFFIIFGYIGIKTFIRSRQDKTYKSLYSYITISSLVALALLPAIYFSFALKAAGALYYGNLDGLWLTTGATLSGLILCSSSILIKYALIFLIISFVVYFIYRWIKKGTTLIFGEPFTLFVGVFIANIIAIEWMRWLMEINYPEDRVGMHLIFLFIGSFLFMLDTFPKYYWLGAVFSLLPIAGIKHFNLNSSAFSPDDRIEQNEFDLLIEQIDKGNPTLAIYNTQILTYAYHVRKNNPTNFTVPRRYTREETFNEEIVSSKMDDVNKPKSKGYEVLKYNPRTWQTILKREKTFDWKTIDIRKSTIPIQTSEMYYNLIDSSWTTMDSPRVKFEFEYKVNTPHLNRETLVFVVDYIDLNGIRSYSSFNLNWAAGKHRVYTFRKALEIEPAKLKDLRVYLYNPNTYNYTILSHQLVLKAVD